LSRPQRANIIQNAAHTTLPRIMRGGFLHNKSPRNTTRYAQKNTDKKTYLPRNLPKSFLIQRQEKACTPDYRKTFGGLSKSYYLRNFFFGLIFLAIYTFLMRETANELPSTFTLPYIVNTFLYSYSRFVYESIVNFIVGKNVFIFPVFVVLFVKLFTVLLCFAFAIFIAPIGLA
jgi:hypothetical protein